MTQETVGRRLGGLPSIIGGQEIQAQAVAEGTRSAKFANGILPPILVLLRFTMGWVFVYSGFDKLLTDFSAGGYLVNATRGPFAGWFQGLGENATGLAVIDPLVVWGEILIGGALILGVMTRWAALWGAVMMFLFYISAFPPEHNPFMEYHLIYILVLGALAALGAGRIMGLDNFIERMLWVRKIPGVSFFLG